MINYSRIPHRLYWSLVLFLIVHFSAHAGLVINVKPGIDVSTITSITIDGDVLTVQYGQSGSYRINLPRNSLYPVLDWSNQDCTGPFIFSIDGALILEDETYAPPCVPATLHDAMFNYDGYAHQLGCGGVPANKSDHPFIALHHGDDLMPQQLTLKYLSSNTSEGLFYRLLATGYTHYDGGVGQITLWATPSKKGFPIKIEVETIRTFLPPLWYREVNAASQEDQNAFDLPFRPLNDDIRQRWPEYRKAFPPMNELSALVEAYALFSALRVQKPKMWDDLIQSAKAKFIYDYYGYEDATASYTPYLSTNFDTYRINSLWTELNRDFIGESIDNNVEADLLLDLINNEKEEEEEWLYEIKSIAEKDPFMRAKLCAFRVQRAESEDRFLEMKKFFRITKDDPGLFQLRIWGAANFRRPRWDIEGSNQQIDLLLSSEGEQVVAEFIRKVKKCRQDSFDLRQNFIVWDNLLQDVYLTGLFNLGSESENAAEFYQQVAYAHYRYGKCYLKSYDFGFVHQQLRYLQYLLEGYPDWQSADDFEKTVHQYQEELAGIMGMKGWDKAPNSLFEFDYSEDLTENNSSSEDDPWKFAVVEGKIRCSAYLFSSRYSAERNLADLKRGTPGGITTDQNQFLLLLLDSHLLACLLEITGQGLQLPVRVSGVLHDHGRSMTPYRLEYQSGGEWHSFDLPASGIGDCTTTNEK